MALADHLSTYAQGWVNGDADTILRAASPGYVFDDPNAGRIAREAFREYLAGAKAELDALRGGAPSGPFLELSEVVTHEADGILTAWCWWTFPGTSIAGSGLIKVGEEGVLSERLCYYTPLAS